MGSWLNFSTSVMKYIKVTASILMVVFFLIFFKQNRKNQSKIRLILFLPKKISYKLEASKGKNNKIKILVKQREEIKLL